MVAHFVRDEGVAGSNPVIPISLLRGNKALDGIKATNPLFHQMVEFEKNPTKVRQSSAKFPQCYDHLLSVEEAAQSLQVNAETVRRWCKSGKLPSFCQPYGTRIRYLVHPQSVELYFLNQREKKPKESKPKQPKLGHVCILADWKLAMEKGLINGKPFSSKTIETYWLYVEPFIQQYKALSAETFLSVFETIPPENFAKKLKFYEAVLCYAKYLIRRSQLSPMVLDEIKSYRPRRHKPPKRISVDEMGLQKLLEASETSLDKVIVSLLASTGIRASEFCNLKRQDIDLEKGILTIRLGKGNKTRRVGLPPMAMEALEAYLSSCETKQNQDWMFHNALRKQMDRYGLRQRLERLGKKADVTVSPHALRRSFVTLNANKGRPLQMLQIACGHADIQTTRGYCLTQEQEVINAMKDW